jgi:gluconolactonase
MELETFAWGYGLVEGPRVDEQGNLFFSDVTKGGIYRRAPDGGISTVIPGIKGVGGIALHAEGGLVISGMSISHILEGNTRILFEVEGVRGFNDLFTDGEGRVYAGSIRSHPLKPGPRIAGELYRIEAQGRAVELYDGVGLSNGIGFSPDGRLLYHSDTAAQAILVHELTPDGRATHRSVFAKIETGLPDGLAVDEAGCVWVASYGGGCVLRYRPDGTRDLRLEVPAKAVTSLCFGGTDRRDLIVVTADNTQRPEHGGTLHRTRAEVPGLAAPLARI